VRLLLRLPGVSDGDQARRQVTAASTARTGTGGVPLLLVDNSMALRGVAPKSTAVRRSRRGDE
jgi:hypothetical protein